MKHNTLTLIQKIAHALESIYPNSIEQQQTAWWMLEAITQSSQAHLIAQSIIDLSDEQEQKLIEWIRLHTEEKEPLQYLLGNVPFGSLTINVRPPILIPRPETEELVVWLIDKLKKLKTKSISILDLCTGSGCIGLLLAKELPKSNICATDISLDALNLAKENAQINHINNIRFIHSDVFETLNASKEKFDLIIANPPYITAKEYKKLDPMVSKWEDKNALTAEHEGLGIIEKIIKGAPLFIVQNEEMKLLNIPQLIIEIGYRQGNKVKELLAGALFNHIRIKKDLEGKDRVALARIN